MVLGPTAPASQEQRVGPAGTEGQPLTNKSYSMSNRPDNSPKQTEAKTPVSIKTTSTPSPSEWSSHKATSVSAPQWFSILEKATPPPHTHSSSQQLSPRFFPPIADSVLPAGSLQRTVTLCYFYTSKNKLHVIN